MNDRIFKKGEAWFMLLLSFGLYYLSMRTSHYWLVFVCFIPFLTALQCLHSLKARLSAGFVFGLLYYGFIFFWTRNINGFILVATVVYQSLFMALFAGGYHILSRNARGRVFACLYVPCLWVAVEYIRSLGYLGLPAGLTGYQLGANLVLIQSASVFGVYGLSFLVLLVNGALFLVIQKDRSGMQRLGLLVFIFAVLGANIAYGRYALSHAQTAREYRTVSVIQPNIKPDKKWDIAFIERNIAVHEDLSRQALSRKPYLIVWPETAVACFLFHPDRKDILQRLQSFIRSIRTPLLIGTQDIRVDDTGKTAYNSAVLFSGTGRAVDKYDKIKLVPFVEKAPVKGLIPLLRKVRGLLPVYSSGRRFTQFDPKGAPFSTVICFEALFPGLVRQFVRRGARWIVNMTNDQPALGDSTYYYQVNADMAIFRAIENRRSLVRAANSGISMAIDPFGRVLERIPADKEGYFTVALPVRNDMTVFNRFGNFIAFFAIGAVIVGLIRNRR